jgi:hypothetical protein
MYADILAWREVPFLQFIVKPLNMLMAPWLPKGSNTESILETFEAFIYNIKSRGFTPIIAHVDSASIITGLTDKAPSP